MKKSIGSLLIILAITLGGQTQLAEKVNNPVPNPKPKMQVVFALDATGSMSGLISAAKDKIWSIVSSLTQTQTAPDIEVGLVFYRDRGDAFITKRIQLTDSMDMVYAELMKIEAQGGGDTPESVNQGLNEAVELFKWDQDTSTYKAIFLVGDCEPHMDYKNDVPWFATCKIAKSKDIVLNTILMGSSYEAGNVWKAISACNDGAFVNVNMNVNDIQVNTPYDSTIAILSGKLDDLRYYYGKTEIKNRGNASKIKTKSMTRASKINVNAQRAEFNTYYFSMKSNVKQNELLSDVASKNVKLDSLKQAELPDEFKNIPKDSLAIVVKQKTELRDSLQKVLNTEIAKRSKYVEAELGKKKKGEVEGSFNNVIFLNIQKQTLKKKIELKGKAKF
jgi:hypothetical protein